jgi:3-oxoacyl-[acyl-carrier-protein] synthase II
MAEARREALITGIGIVCCLGEGPEAVWQGLMERRSNVDATSFAPYIVHPLAPINLDLQIPKKGDQRQMEPWQRIGTYAAGLALDHAGIKGNAELLARTDMIVAAGGGERDLAVDSAILSSIDKAPDPEAFLNERLMSDLRPTLFLAQLSNLLAGNISIVHGVTGSSRTFMGEESSGVDALRIALARIQSGDSELALVGGSQHARPDTLLLYEFARANLRDRFVPVWQRGPHGGMALASMGAFLVLEARGHAEARGAKPLAKLSAVLSDRARAGAGARRAVLEAMWQRLAPAAPGGAAAMISGASGAEPATGEERAFLAAHSDVPVRATGSLIGHGFEPQIVMNTAIATLALRHGKLFPPDAEGGIERDSQTVPERIVVTSVGVVRGEGMALVEKP